MLPAVILKLLLPKVLDHLMKVFKLDQLLDYMELPNDADRRIDVLEKEIQELKNVAHPPVIELKRIEKIEQQLSEIELIEIIDEGQAGDA